MAVLVCWLEERPACMCVQQPAQGNEWYCSGAHKCRRCRAAASLLLVLTLPTSMPLPPPCRQVVLAASRMLGALSPLRLGAIASRWVAELSKLMRAGGR